MVTINIAAHPCPKSDHATQLRRAVIASTVGTTLRDSGLKRAIGDRAYIGAKSRYKMALIFASVPTARCAGDEEQRHVEGSCQQLPHNGNQNSALPSDF
jgi:hypothetical protein